MTAATILALLAGKAVPFAQGEHSAIEKAPLAGRGRITFQGIEGDEQADLRYHGGPAKALHHYPFDHYARWRELSPNQPLLLFPGAFGENLSSEGLLESEVCIGDRFRLGSALVEVSQGRQPCWKQGARLTWAQLPALMVKERRSGWYYRVLEEGEAEAGDRLTLTERSLPEWSVARVFGLLVAGDFRKDRAALKALAGMTPLFPGWRQRAVDLLGT